MQDFSIPLQKVVSQLNVEVVYTPCDLKDIPVYSADVNRPGLLLAGYNKFFDATRIQVCGMVEMWSSLRRNITCRCCIRPKIPRI